MSLVARDQAQQVVEHLAIRGRHPVVAHVLVASGATLQVNRPHRPRLRGEIGDVPDLQGFIGQEERPSFFWAQLGMFPRALRHLLGIKDVAWVGARPPDADVPWYNTICTLIAITWILILEDSARRAARLPRPEESQPILVLRGVLLDQTPF